MIQQAWPVAIVEETVRTAAQQKQLLQRIQRLVDRSRAGKGAIIMPLVPPCTAMFLDTWEFMIHPQQDEGEAFVVAQQHIIGRAIALDQLRLQQQGLRLTIGGHNRHRSRQRDHSAQAIGQAVNLHIIADAVFKRARLADIQHIAARVVHAVHAGFQWQGLQDIADGGCAGFQIRCVRTTHGVGGLLLVKTRSRIGLIGAVGFGHVGVM